jgi:hypothetical protein
LTLLTWWRELPTDEQPPAAIYGDDEALTEWFNRIKVERASKYGSSGADGGFEDVPQASVQNEYLIERLARQEEANSE